MYLSNVITTSYLCHQDANHHTQLMQRAEGSSESSGGDLTHVHGCQPRAETAEHTDDQPPHDDHLVRTSQARQSHETPPDDSQDVSKQHGLTPEEERQGGKKDMVSG